MELLALLIEETSVISSKHQRKKPLKIPRPRQTSGPGSGMARRAAGGDGSGNVVDFEHAKNVLRQTGRRR